MKSDTIRRWDFISNDCSGKVMKKFAVGGGVTSVIVFLCIFALAARHSIEQSSIPHYTTLDKIGDMLSVSGVNPTVDTHTGVLSGVGRNLLSEESDHYDERSEYVRNYEISHPKLAHEAIHSANSQVINDRMKFDLYF